MAANRSENRSEFSSKKSRLENLPVELLYHIFGSADNPTISSMAQTSSRLHFIFQPIVSARLLLQAVINAEWETVERITQANPSLMFQSVHVTHLDGRTEQISPLKYAFNVFDTYSWKIFLRNMSMDASTVFLRQANTQKEHFNFEPLFKAYNEYIACFNFAGPTVTSDKLQRCWLNIGLEQSKLPLGFLKDFCNPHTAANPEAPFLTVTRPPLPSAFNPITSQNTLLLPIHQANLGRQFALSLMLRQCSLYSWVSNVLAVQSDLKIFQRLVQTRKADLTQQIELLQSRTRRATL